VQKPMWKGLLARHHYRIVSFYALATELCQWKYCFQAVR